MTLHAEIMAALKDDLVALGVVDAERVTSGRRWVDKPSTLRDARIELVDHAARDAGFHAVAVRTYIVWLRDGQTKPGSDGSGSDQLDTLEPDLTTVLERYGSGLNPLRSAVSRVKACDARTEVFDRNPAGKLIEGGVRITLLVEQASYSPASALAAVNNEDGTLSLSWTNPSGAVGMVLRRASGSTPPETVEDGTGVTLGGALATSVVDSPGFGTWSYALFAGYDTRNVPATTADAYSAAVELTAQALPPDPSATLGSKLFAWYDPSDSDTVTLVGSGVSVLADLSPNGYDLSQATSGKRPTISSEAINGLDALAFDHDAAQKLFGDIDAPAYELTVWIVFKPGADVATYSTWLLGIVDQDYGAGVGRWLAVQSTNALAAVAYAVNDDGSLGGQATKAAAFEVGTVAVVRARFVSAADRLVTVDDDGADAENTTDIGTLTLANLDRLCLGGVISAFIETGATDGLIGEVVAAVGPTAGEINAVDNWLAARWQ